jgi:glyoxylase-like metal-dependent hydrolase (beta-lactamase superfamily II)
VADDVLEVADRLWRGEIDIASLHPVGGYMGGLAEVAGGVAFVPSFANVSAFTTAGGLVLVDTGSSFAAAAVHEELRRWSPERLDTAIYSHGHIDHVFGVPVWEAEAAERDWPPPLVVAHEAVPARFDRYIATAGYNELVNQRQFGVPGLRWPREYRYPDTTYGAELDLEAGGRLFQLRHAKGETDDHTWTWVADEKVLCCGDLFIWASPNAGNPQKVQRYPAEWAAALRRMVELGAEVLLPGHGMPVMGAGRVRQALADTAELLESLVAQTLELMNGGARLDEVLHGVRPPAALAGRPYLRAVYDEPEFVVRNIWRLYGGWWDGNPASLKPAPEAALAAEVAALCGGPGVLAERALALVEEASPDGASAQGASARGASAQGASAQRASADGALRLAGHLAEMAALAAPGDPALQRARATVYRARADHATSTMARGVFGWAARQSATRADEAR